MGFVVWYKFTFRANGAPLATVSNDVLHGDFIVDAEFTAESKMGREADKFTLTLHDLPLETAEQLAARHLASTPLSGPLGVDIQLGYFDDTDSQRTSLMLGIVTKIKTTVAGNGELLTVVEGNEVAGYYLARTPFYYDQLGSSSLGYLLDRVHRETDVVVDGKSVTGDRKDFTTRTSSALEALALIAEDAELPLYVTGGKAVIGVPDQDPPPAVFSPDTNITRQGRKDEQRDVAAPPVRGTSYELQVLGDPSLHIGRRVRIDGVDADNLRLKSVTTSFTLAGGYVCEVLAMDAAATKLPTGAETVTDSMHQMIRNTIADRPAVDVGDVTAYAKAGEGEQGGHRATLHYGQKPKPDVTTPSVDGEVDETRTLHQKPLVSPFAWDRCGLIVPVYEGMRAVLVHNEGSVNDALAAGFTWSRQAGHAPPGNEPGDYWLCLPTGVDNGRPAGKGVNDLTDATGRRVIQAAGLSITVGEDKLPDVGSRPEPPAARTFVIEHDQGTKVAITDDGSVTVTTEGKDITLGDGQASITISGSTITLSAQTVKLDASSVEVG
ncbi:hypothetical protein [Kutzneria kofuensis]|uniref:Gp5/Type VI secretion system Vgr protein OB-fold domain-containing protein n=1 Tax=Kutzneria kofuensis TaxID=103725 RepID=A0A7W9KP00_9PSEU|nr:hypothetical protein [Kutzneria kofuensis]MBB5896057.1 hypothetical protein [Kutzneria kofuensis]